MLCNEKKLENRFTSKFPETENGFGSNYVETGSL